MDEYRMPLYTAEDEMDLKDYKSVCFAMTNRTRSAISIVISAMFALVGIGYIIVTRELPGAIIFFAAAIIHPLLVNYMYGSIIKKTYESTKIAHDRRIFYSFFADSMAVQTEIGNSIVKYSELRAVKETEEYFRMLVAGDHGYPLRKAKCEEELVEFIRKIKL